jgi:hypothetical protein
MAMVPLSECRIPTLIVSPDAGDVDAAGDAAEDAAGDSVELVVGLLAQAFRRMLVPSVAEPYSKNFRRPNCLVIESFAPL